MVLTEKPKSQYNQKIIFLSVRLGLRRKYPTDRNYPTTYAGNNWPWLGGQPQAEIGLQLNQWPKSIQHSHRDGSSKAKSELNQCLGQISYFLFYPSKGTSDTLPCHFTIRVHYHNPSRGFNVTTHS